MRRAPRPRPGDLHVFSMEGERFLLDVPRSAAYHLSQAGAAAVGGYLQRRTDRDPDGGSAGEELASLLTRGFLRPDTPPAGAPEAGPTSKSVELSVTHRCTMRCRYCYSAHDAEGRGVPLDMPDEVLDAACEWAVRRFGRDCSHVHLTTGTTGEALLRPEAYARVQANAARLREATGKIVSHAVGSSNLTLADDQAAWALLSSTEHHVFTISMDGPRHIHDRMRVFPDGRGSYDMIVEALAELRRRGRRLNAQAVITGENPDVTSVFQHLCELGFNAIILRPARVPRHEPFAIGSNTIDAVKQGFSDLVAFLFRQDDAALLGFLRHLWHVGDFLGRFLIRIASRAKVLYRCPAGKDWACVDTNGDIYPCPGMIGTPELRIGSVFSDIEPRANELYRRRLLVTRKRSCVHCWARYLCGGGCYHAAHIANGRIDTPDPCDCALTKHLIELAIYAVARLREERPAVLAAIGHSLWGMIDHMSVIPCLRLPEALRLDSPAEQWRSPQPLQFGRAEQMQWRIWEGPQHLGGEVHVGWSSAGLHVMVDWRAAELQGQERTSLFSMYLTPPEATTRVPVPDWWKGYVEAHRLSYEAGSRSVVLSSGREELGGSVRSKELPAHVESEGGCVRVRVFVPWVDLTPLTPDPERAITVNASFYHRNAKGTSDEMQWLPDYAFGLLRLIP